MKTIQFNLPVFVFFDSEGNVISYRHQDCENLFIPFQRFAQIVHEFDPSVPNAHTIQPSMYEIPITVTLDDEQVVYVNLDSIEKVYGKKHHEIISLFKTHSTF